MLIDWFTVLAQIFNFLILVYLLKRFLYGRIIAAMNEREERIATRLEEAEKKKQEADQERKSYLQKNNEYDAKCESLFANARQEAEEQKKEFMEGARREIEELKKRWHDSLREEKKTFLSNLRKSAEQQIYAIASKALSDLSNSGLEQSIIDTFIRKIKELDHDELDRLRKIIKSSSHEATISSAFEISDDKQQKVTREISGVTGETVDIKYITSQELICGIEFKVNNYKVEWNLKDYIKTLEEEVDRAIEEEVTRQK